MPIRKSSRPPTLQPHSHDGGLSRSSSLKHALAGSSREVKAISWHDRLRVSCSECSRTAESLEAAEQCHHILARNEIENDVKMSSLIEDELKLPVSSPEAQQ